MMSLHSDRLTCKECGICCKSCNITFKENPDTDWIAFLEVRGTTRVEVDGGFIFLNRDKCPQLNDNGDCNIQETKPQYCIDFPFNLPEESKRILANVCPLLEKE